MDENVGKSDLYEAERMKKVLKDFWKGYWDDAMKAVVIFGALPGSKELLLLVKEWCGVASETGNNSALYKVLGAGAPRKDSCSL